MIIHLKKRKTWETDSYLYNYTPVWQRIFFKLRTLKKIQSALNLGPNQPSSQKIKVCFWDQVNSHIEIFSLWKYWFDSFWFNFLLLATKIDFLIFSLKRHKRSYKIIESIHLYPSLDSCFNQFFLKQFSITEASYLSLFWKKNVVTPLINACTASCCLVWYYNQ